VLNPILSSATGAITRYFTEFDNVAQSYVDVGTQVDVSESVISLYADFAINSVDNLNNILGLYTSDASEAIGVRIEEFGVLKFYSEGFTPGMGSTVVTDGKLHNLHATLNKATGDIEVWLDGNLEYTSSHSDLSKLKGAYKVSIGVRIKSVGGVTDSHYSGVISNSKIDNSGSTVLDIPINQNYTSTNNTVIDLSGNGNNGTFVNVADGDSTLYTQNSDGDWVDGSGNVLEVAY
tara:strand:+ start:20502 stop:21203 length:702 start_codon:yes stop_codon:yes gene_type:complete